MLKKIATSQVRLGMYLHGLEGSWLRHPFWKTKFVLDDLADVAALQGSGVPFCWIDVELGADIDAAGPANSEQGVAPAACAQKQTAGSVSGTQEVGGMGLTSPLDARDGSGDGSIAGGATRPSAGNLKSEQPAGSSSHSQRPALAVTSSMKEELDRAAQVLSKSKKAVTHLFNEARLGRAIDAQQCLPLVEEIAGSVVRNPSALISLARLKTQDDYTYMHSIAVCALMISLARQLQLSAVQIREAGLAGLLHDVGKMAMPPDVLNKPGALTDDEFAVMRKHPRCGYEMLKDGSAVPASALDVALHHHEKMDGTGYPDKLAGEQISLLARMGAVCDVYDAVTSIRPYKPAWDAATSLARMAQWKGHFDPQVFQAFVKCVGIYPVGTLVKLSSGKLAVVVEQNAAALTAPKVRVFYSTKSRLPIPTQLLDLTIERDRILGREDGAAWDSQMIQELWQKR